MKKASIYGAGSIGNHLAFACRNKGWDVTLCDIDREALERTKDSIYPERYGGWDKNIRLVELTEGILPEKSDVVIIGTPPDTHFGLALKILKSAPPEVMLIEKPLCSIDMKHARELLELAGETGTKLLTGYNHTLTRNTLEAEALIQNNLIGNPLYLYAGFREHWKGIFKAHPWLNGPEDSYLGYSSRGGGAGGEHSHALNIWQHFSHQTGMGRIEEVSAMLDVVDDGACSYDRIFQVNVKTERGLHGHIVQDVITKPPKKMLSLQGDSGFIEWHVNFDEGRDAVLYSGDGCKVEKILIEKTRPDDFKGEVDHIESILDGKIPNSPISVERGLDTMLVLAGAHLSNQTGRSVRINYDKGYSPDALEAEK